MNGRGRRAKGARGQREAAAAWTAATGLPARNGGQAGQVAGMDLEQPAAVRLEVKRTERLRLWEALDQAKRDAGGLPYAVLHRANGRPWAIILPMEDLVPFIEAVQDARRGHQTVTRAGTPT